MQNALKYISYRIRNLENDSGYTILEILFVAGIVVTIALMGMGSFKSQRRYGIEMTCVTKMKELAQVEESYRDLGDPALNPSTTYGTFYQMQNAGLIPKIFSPEDNVEHSNIPFIPFYKIEIVQSPTALDQVPSSAQYMIFASPAIPGFRLRIFMMQEDGEVYYYTDNTSGIRQVWQ
jgi:hypothetical protein